MQRLRVGILGATGLVGQGLVRRLAAHPWFDLAAVAASERSAGRSYREATRWLLPLDPPPAVEALIVQRAEPAAFAGCDLVLSALDAASGRELEPRFLAAGFTLVSNSAAHRQQADVPLLVPEVNAAQVDLVVHQRRRGRGAIVTNPNCSVAGLALVIGPLHRAFGVRRLVVTTFQAVSGAGLGGPLALELLDNVLPFIGGEEPKIESELGKILGRVDADAGAVRPDPIVVSAHCHRVASIDGHLEAVSLELEREAEPAQVAGVLRAFRGDVAELGLPSAPRQPIVVREEPDRPQPRLDRDAGDGMSAVVGRIRPCPVLGLKLVLLSHNTVRGAAGGTLLAAELLVARGLVERRTGA